MHFKDRLTNLHAATAAFKALLQKAKYHTTNNVHSFVRTYMMQPQPQPQCGNLALSQFQSLSRDDVSSTWMCVKHQHTLKKEKYTDRQADGEK
jgi:hypothetical protein